MTYIETTTLSKTVFRTTVWKCYIHDMFSLWDMSKPDIEQASLHHPTIEFTTETFDTETAFLDTVVYRGTRFKVKSILDAKTHFKKTETFLYTHFTWSQKTSSETTFEENNSNLKKKTLDGRRLPTIFDRKPTIGNKIHQRAARHPLYFFAQH